MAVVLLVLVVLVVNGSNSSGSNSSHEGMSCVYLLNIFSVVEAVLL